MSVYTVTTYEIDVIGYLWMPNNVIRAQRFELSPYYALDVLLGGNGLGSVWTGDAEQLKEITRDDLESELFRWTGDFSEVVDFRASLADHEIPWSNEESEFTFNDCMFGGME